MRSKAYPCGQSPKAAPKGKGVNIKENIAKRKTNPKKREAKRSNLLCWKLLIVITYKIFWRPRFPVHIE
jgi:hypothetical protein